MLRQLTRNWWVIVLRGVCAIVFGLIAFASPGVTLSALILLWGAYAFADGVLALVAGFSGAAEGRWWTWIAWALVSLLAAASALLYPGITAMALLYLIAAWALITGTLQLAAAIRLRKEIEGEFWLALAGVGSLLFGVLLIARPGAGAVAVMWLIGVYAVAFGIFLVALGLRVKGLRDLGQHVRARHA
jgi:uncharacterized membrane protein HdeD (DUF308 family)